VRRVGQQKCGSRKRVYKRGFGGGGCGEYKKIDFFIKTNVKIV